MIDATLIIGLAVEATLLDALFTETGHLKYTTDRPSLPAEFVIIFGTSFLTILRERKFG